MRLFPWMAAVVVLGVAGCSDSTGPGGGGAAPLTFIALSSGNARTCALAADSTAWCWGLNAGILGTTGGDTRPIATFPGTRFDVIAVGSTPIGPAAVCALEIGGSSMCTGHLDVDEDLVITLPAGEPLPGGVSLSSVSIGIGHICGVSAGNSANCWGEFDGGPRGLSSISFDTSYATMTPNIVDGGHVWTQVVAGYSHTCGLDQAGAGWCWGADNVGQLGRAAGAPDTACGLALSPCSKVPIAVDGGHVFTSLSAGGAHTCGVTTAGDVYCWGSDDAGQLGVDGASDLCQGAFHIRCALAPVKVNVQGPVIFTQVSVGGSHTCALSDSLQAYCWGDDSYGQLGIGGGRINIAWPVKTDLRFVALAAGANHTCGIAVGGAAWCWGDNASGELGNGTTLDVNVPVPVAGP